MGRRELTEEERLYRVRGEREQLGPVEERELGRHLGEVAEERLQRVLDLVELAVHLVQVGVDISYVAHHVTE